MIVIASVLSCNCSFLVFRILKHILGTTTSKMCFKGISRHRQKQTMMLIEHIMCFKFRRRTPEDLSGKNLHPAHFNHVLQHADLRQDFVQFQI